MKFSTPATAAAALAFLAPSALAAPAHSYGSKGCPEGFVYTEGSKFMLDGEPFLFAGKSDAHVGLQQKNTTFNPLGLPQYGGEGAGVSPVYFQEWNNGVATINYGPTGLQALDKVVELAEQTGLKLIMALTNNWADYGGMDVYTVNLGGQYHDDFYHVPKIVNAFKHYVSVVVNRYKNSPAVFAWELMNEPAAAAQAVETSPVLQVQTARIKHMITWGGEGEFYEPGNADWREFLNELALPEMDFGTFHLYPDWWSKTVAWSNQWILDHAAASKKLNKPVLLEEYGWLLDADKLAWLGESTPANETKESFGMCGLSFGCSTDDGFTIFLNETDAGELVYEHAREVNAENARLGN
ncbi:related mannan endo-1,4-beta-mannosidase C [Phialocephala subalpina]|uniref:mannan endo-1,4-beta-mannosidase n=1 Tax=Phialocephala subalpina TaxID=576137 RepID=A0A1L7XKN3_9HELO|nr:related mannan endo-1,4-beta-mannosidase C [Phialocephala subalpina]